MPGLPEGVTIDNEISIRIAQGLVYNNLLDLVVAEARRIADDRGHIVWIKVITYPGFEKELLRIIFHRCCGSESFSEDYKITEEDDKIKLIIKNK
ncbi:MAG TPA: hypothetical protein ENI19_00695 [Candidatus Nealsonbacteria bacterium]|uniref:THUMP domain-containing protein n=1 Tax=marine sediment metagenome TaxID=412755 RepID=A0A0F9S1L5_9ZZZZ|nr:hypothetical protein [Candidatus Nealsonbacteria bacterium]HEB46210.1 hypothetical protein [Candidatus Nealsonbacteria bacterium]